MLTRFAPAPTGYLHLGHVVNAIYVWGIARATGGRVLLRVEDHDQQRSRPEFERAMLDDLDWLGFRPDAPATDDFRAGVCAWRQSDRRHFYESALTALETQGLIYACECSRRGIASAAPQVDGAELFYPGTCAGRRLADGAGMSLRVRLSPSVERFEDGVHGWLAQTPSEQCGDLVVRDRDGNFTYQFAVVVDDWLQEITHVIRGDDLLASTGRQIQLARLIGRDQPPRFLHHPLVMKSATQKLSKADRDTSIRDLRAAGATAEELIGRAALLAGLCDTFQPMAVAAVSDLPAIRALANSVAASEALIGDTRDD